MEVNVYKCALEKIAVRVGISRACANKLTFIIYIG